MCYIQASATWDICQILCVYVCDCANACSQFVYVCRFSENRILMCAIGVTVAVQGI